MSLRNLIKEAIVNNAGDPEKTSIEVCKILENEIGLSGNGWFDDDEVLLDELRMNR